MFSRSKNLDWQTFQNRLSKNIPPALVLFLVGLPLNLGVAIASGVPAQMGIISGVIGSIFVGALSGTQLMVSGPDAGIGVLVLEMIQEQGIAKLGVIVLLAGLMQLILGLLRAANWYRIISPAVVNGMLGGMGLLIVLTQFHIMLDRSPHTTGFANFYAIGESVLSALTPAEGLSHHPAACIGLLSITSAILWERFAKFTVLRTIPSALVAILVASATTLVLNLPIQLIKIPEGILSTIELEPITALLASLNSSAIWICAATLAFVSSAQSILTATAIDTTAKNHKSNLDRELVAQGLGNIVCGFLGALPVAGVLLRSMTNVQNGADSRIANIMHGMLLLLAVCFCPLLLNYMPISALAAILVLVGCRMVTRIYRNVRDYAKAEMVIVLVTVLAVLATNLFTGVIVGFAVALAKELSVLAYLGISLERQENSNRTILHLAGAATFLQVPRLISALESVPDGTELHVALEKVSYIDHACLELLINWAKQHKAAGGSLIIDWETFHARLRAANMPQSHTPQAVTVLRNNIQENLR